MGELIDFAQHRREAHLRRLQLARAKGMIAVANVATSIENQAQIVPLPSTSKDIPDDIA